jgi:hypothetical protein
MDGCDGVQDVTPRTMESPTTTRSDEIPTPGEYAERALLSFAALQNAVSLPDEGRADAVNAAGVQLVDACVALMRKFPIEARHDFASVMPFTNLELYFLRQRPIGELSIVNLIGARLLEWATRSPIFLDEANVHAADFLERLAPHLDLWSQRQLAAAAARRLASV